MRNSVGNKPRKRTGAWVLRSKTSGVRYCFHRYFHGPLVDQVLADDQVASAATDEVLWSLADHHRSVRRLVEFTPSTDAIGAR